jgi:hypothetical protein
MNDNAGDRRRPRLWRAGLAAAAAGIALLAAACGGTGTTGAGTSGGASYAKALAYVKCMRSHGFPDFPAPDAQGSIPSAYISPGDQALAQKAGKACGSLSVPGEGSGLSAMQLQALQQQNLKNAVKAARCMRAHGIEGFPDPAAGPPGSTVDGGVNFQPVQSALQAARFSTSTPSYEAAYHACAGNIPPPFWPGASGFGGPVPP